MISKEEARKLAMTQILQSKHFGYEPVIIDDNTTERNFAWVFFWTSREYLETGNIKLSLASNSPIIVNKFDGSTHRTGTARDIEHYICEYEKTLNIEK